MKFILSFLLVFLVQHSFTTAQAQGVVADLKPWQTWVDYQQEFYRCPFFYNNNKQLPSAHVCAWPSALSLAIDGKEAGFSMQWQVIEDSWVVLPGGYKSWPKRVVINNKNAAVQNHNQQPRVFLKKGTYSIKGEFSWSKRPQSLPLPDEIAAVLLSVDKKFINFPKIENHNLWLGEQLQNSKQQKNSTDISVNRLIIDDHPMTMFVNIELKISGAARMEKLGKIGTKQLQITAISGDLSSYVDKQGYLWAQLKPGNYSINLAFIIRNWASKISFQAIGDNWPRQEIWAYQDNKNIRLTEIKGVESINPKQVASQWSRVPNYLVNSGEVFEIVESKRGTLNQDGQFFLSRTIWLGFDGQTYRSQDIITGTKLGSWRLNAEDSYKLLNAKSGSENLLITVDEQKKQGLELRTPNVDLVVNAEFNKNKTTAITPWQTTFENIEARVYVPHGYLPLAASNVDMSRGLWLEKWKLWDIFIIMLITVFCYKAINASTAAVAFISLVLGYQEANMPVIAWINILVVMAIFSYKLTGKLRVFLRFYAILSVLGLLLVLLPFLISQVRLSLYPQLENVYQDYVSISKYDKSVQKLSKKRVREVKNYSQTYNNKMIQQTVQAASEPVADEEQAALVPTGSAIRNADVLNRYQSGAVLQAGKAIPQWHNNRIFLQWDGPIVPNQSYHLYIISPLVRVLWRLLLVVTSVLWLLFLLQKYQKSRPKSSPQAQADLPHSATILVLLLAIPSLGFSQSFPSQQLLDQLHARLYPPAVCKNNCATLDTLRLNINKSKLVMNLEYHAFESVIVPLPHSEDWRIMQLSANGKEISQRIKHNKVPWIRVNKGINHITLVAKLATQNKLAIVFPLLPNSINAAAEGWQIAGIDEKVLKNDTLQLISTQQQAQSSEKNKNTDIPPFVNIVRRLTFDDDWTVRTSVTRVAPVNGVINLAIPLLQGEHPTDTVKINEKNQLELSLATTQNTFVWKSKLEKSSAIDLVAAANPSYLETWEVLASPQWNIAITGLPVVTPSNLRDQLDDYFVHIYKPHEGEKLHIKMSRPQAKKGKIVAIESIENIFAVGKRSTKTKTTIKYRATQGGKFQIHLHKLASINSVAYDGVNSNLSHNDGVVEVGFLPGSHRVEINWQLSNDLGFVYETPYISLENAIVNINQTAKVPRSRWLLYARSAGVGPAFLYWGELVFFTILAFFLAKLPFSLLKFWQWLVLGYAFGTVSWLPFGIVVAWLFFIGWKKQLKDDAINYKSILLQWFTVFFTLFTLVVFIGSIAYGLLSYPNMGIAGKASSSHYLQWYLDSYQGQVPSIKIYSLPLWFYKGLMLVWSIWLSFSLLNWLKITFKTLHKTKWWKKPQSQSPSQS